MGAKAEAAGTLGSAALPSTVAHSILQNSHQAQVTAQLSLQKAEPALHSERRVPEGPGCHGHHGRPQDAGGGNLPLSNKELGNTLSRVSKRLYYHV